MPWLLNRVSFSAAIIAVSILVHLGFVGAIVLAERRVLPPSDLRAIDVDLVKPEDIEPKKDEPPEPPEPPKQALPKPPQIAKSEVPLSKPDTKPAPEQLDTPSPEEKRAARPDTPQGGPAGEGKSKLTPEEIAALRAQIQKCWKLPVGMPGMIGLEVVLRVSFAPKGQLVGQPVLLQAPASARGPVLVGIALDALKECRPFKLPSSKYADWKSLDLKFTATGMTGLASRPKNLPKI